jgi:hypothetical protein
MDRPGSGVQPDRPERAHVSFIFGKAFQAAGIVCVPLALYYGVFRDDLRTEFKIWIFALILFGIGWLSERRRR